MSTGDPVPAGAPARGGPALAPLAVKLLFAALVTYRLAYHATYMGEVPFALGTFSDGAVYEQMARDILDDPPLGSEPFYLQGFYAYFLAAAMAFRPWIAMGLIAQVLLACAANLLFYRAAVQLWGRSVARVSVAILLAYPALAFYENKFLSAELGVACNVFALWAFARLLAARGRRAELGWAGLVGASAGLAMLARTNMALAVPFTALALVALTRGGPGPRGRRLAGLLVSAAFGLLLALAPMAARNLLVTGAADLGPVHGGGTSFYIGNNPKSMGVWNDAELVSGRLGAESLELASELGIDEQDPRLRARAVGDALYERAFAWMREHPGEWTRLELRKLWLVIGNDEITQDYDWYGERELIPWAHRVGVPFSVVLALGLLGVWGARRLEPPGRASAGGGEALAVDAVEGRARTRAWMLMWIGQVAAPLAANLIFFTSSQHRLPLAVPLALSAGVGIVAVARGWRQRPRLSPSLPWLLVLGVLVLQGWWPRAKLHEPHPVHYYNLAIIQDETGSPLDALVSLDRAVELRPDQPHFRFQRAHLRYRLGELDGAEEDLRHSLTIEDQPSWLLAKSRGELELIRRERERRQRQPGWGRFPPPAPPA